MRSDDIQRLRHPYPTDHPLPINERFADTLGVRVAAARELAQEISNDLDESAHGIGWWQAYLPTPERILISDQVLQCAHSIQGNLVELRLHLLEVDHFRDQYDRFIADAVQAGPGGPRMVLPPRLAPEDDLPEHMLRLHLTGAMRAANSALDCLGAVIVGILALSTDLRKADMGSARRVLHGLRPDGSPGRDEQVRFAATLDAAIASAGPDGWLTWASQFRNMLVHRARRIDLVELEPRTPVLFDGAGQPILRARIVAHLPCTPDESDIEAFVFHAGCPVMAEEATVTLNGVMQSTLRLAGEICDELRRIWSLRRKDPQFLVQPRQQWKTCNDQPFPGYRPGSRPYTPDVMVMSPEQVRRLKVMALDDQSRSVWQGVK